MATVPQLPVTMDCPSGLKVAANNLNACSHTPRMRPLGTSMMQIIAGVDSASFAASVAPSGEKDKEAALPGKFSRREAMFFSSMAPPKRARCRRWSLQLGVSCGFPDPGWKMAKFSTWLASPGTSALDEIPIGNFLRIHGTALQTCR